MLRVILGVGAGLTVAMILIAAIEAVTGLWFQLPANFEAMDRVDQAQAMAAMPSAAKRIIVIGWALGAALGAYLAMGIARSGSAAWTVGGLVAISGIINVVMLPHPFWMQLAAVWAPLLGCWTVARLARATGRSPQADPA